MNGKRKPLVWSWPPVKRNGEPAPDTQTIKAEITVENGQAQPAGETSPPEMEAVLNQDETVPAQAAEAQADAAPEEPGSSAEEERVKPLPGTEYPPEVPGPVLPGMELARAYVLYQRYGPTYPPREALEKGTLFPDLYRPYPY